jgi:hypothetical protein
VLFTLAKMMLERWLQQLKRLFGAKKQVSLTAAQYEEVQRQQQEKIHTEFLTAVRHASSAASVFGKADSTIVHRVHEVITDVWGLNFVDDNVVGELTDGLKQIVVLARDLFGDGATVDVCLDLYLWIHKTDLDNAEARVRFAVRCAREAFGDDVSPTICLKVLGEFFGSVEEEEERELE